MNEKSDKPIKNITAIIIVAILVAVSIYFYSKLKNRPVNVPNNNLTQEDIMKNQLKELEILRSKNDSQQLTEEKKNGQLKELEKMRSKNASSATTEQIKKLEEELAKLRSGN